MYKVAQISIFSFSLLTVSFAVYAQSSSVDAKLQTVTAGKQIVKPALTPVKAAAQIDSPIIRLRYPVPLPENGWLIPSGGGVIKLNANAQHQSTIHRNSWVISGFSYSPIISNISDWNQQISWSLLPQYRNNIISNNQAAMIYPKIQVSSKGGRSDQVLVNYCDGLGACPNFQYQAVLTNLQNNILKKVGGQGAGDYSFIGCVGDTTDQVKNNVTQVIGGSRYIICCFKQGGTEADKCTLQ